MTKTVNITYNGKTEVVEFKESLTFGEVEDLLSGSVDLTDVTKPAIDVSKYRIGLLTKVITKAPFKIHDMTAIKMLDNKVVRDILKGVLKYHPLADYIEEWMETFQSLEGMKKLE